MAKRIPTTQVQATLIDLDSFCRIASKPRTRTLEEFCEQDIVIPEGNYAGRRFRYHRQPAARLLHREIDSGYWRRYAVTGCVQSGKTLWGLILPIMWMLFEHKQTIVFGIPQMDVAGDKWRKEILPTVQAQPRFMRHMPTRGKGSKGGAFESISFLNGAELKFMPGHGGDEKRSSFTAGAGFVTEADKMDQPKPGSREADPVTQIEQRLHSFAEDALFYLECTVSTEAGRIWQEIKAGSDSRIMCQCPHCNEYVAPERQHFRGFEQATSERGAERVSFFHCPKCDQAINDKQRRRMNDNARLVHKGQSITPDGKIAGDMPETYTLGFRYSAFNNMFWPSSWLGWQEYKRMHAKDQDNAEKEACQFRWVIPYQPPGVDITHINIDKTLKRQKAWTKGLLPDDTETSCIGIDLGKRVGHWTWKAWRENRQGHVVDYGKFEIPSDDIGVERGILYGLRDFRDQLAANGIDPTIVWIDARYQGGRDKKEAWLPVYEFIKDEDTDQAIWYPTIGWDTDRQSGRKYNQPTKIGNVTVHIGNQFHIDWSGKHGCFIVNVNADYWKLQAQRMYLIPEVDKEGNANPGYVSLFSSLNPNEHLSYLKHITAEQHRFEDDKVVWEVLSRANHWLDADQLATAAGSFCGFTLLDLPEEIGSGDDQTDGLELITPDGRDFVTR